MRTIEKALAVSQHGQGLSCAPASSAIVARMPSPGCPTHLPSLLGWPSL